MADVKKTIRKYALQNAVRYDGKANPGNVIGKVLGDVPELRKDAKSAMKQIQEIVREVNMLSVEEQTKELKKLAPSLLEKKKEEKEALKPLKNAKEGKVVMRFAPSPSGPMHIGHACVLSLNSEYCRKYKGKLIFRIEDTNPDNIYPPVYEIMPDEAKWITKNNVKDVLIQSKRMEKYYKYAEELIKKGNAYVCTCRADEFKRMRIKKKACPCRNLPEKENMERWKKMLKEYKVGEAVLRIKTDIKHKNPAMRDWPAFRINETPHPLAKEKYRVWPLMNFSVAIDDHESGVTHSIRAKDHMDNAKKQQFIYDYMKWKAPVDIYVGRINFTNLKVSASETRKLIEKGEYSGWDDIRLPFLAALRRRGFQPEAFIEHALEAGVTQNDKTMSKEDFFKGLAHFNTEVLEPKAERYFFIEDPVEITIESAPKQDIELDLHPENKKGGRKFKTDEKFIISKQDFKMMKDGKVHRLMDCLNFTKKGKKFAFDSLEYDKFKQGDGMIIHWLPKNAKTVDAEVLMIDNSRKKGVAESGADKLKEGDIIQFERFAFVRLDKKSKDKIEFWFTNN